VDTFSDFDALISWDDFHEVINWENGSKWTMKSPYSIDVGWLKRQIKRMTSKLNRRRFENYGGRRLEQDEALKQGLNIFRKDAFDFLTAHLSSPLKDFLSACIDIHIDIPATPFRQGSFPRTKMEPCGKEIITSPCNLGPEWLRHFLRALYDRKEFKEKTYPNKYFPFENRDHFVHSILVAAVGQLILSAPIDAAVKQSVKKELAYNFNKEVDLSWVDTVQDLMSEIYYCKFHGAFKNQSQVNDWVKQAWPAVAFWHDSGYDVATWFLLTFREFSHCEALKDIVKKNGEMLWCLLDDLKRLLGDELYYSIDEFLDNIKSITDIEHHILWYLDAWKEETQEKKTWGRCHALFSSYEFLKRFFFNRSSPLGVQLAVAIAEHHEEMDPTLSEEYEINDRDLARRFIRNPMGEILSFADAVSDFSRSEIRDMNSEDKKTSGGLGRISFTIDFNLHQISLWEPYGRRFQFFKGIKWDEARMKIKKRALWGDFCELNEDSKEGLKH